MTIQNILVILISYFIGSLLPAELVSWVVKRRPCSEIGSGNPGFANITSSLGVFAGLIVLAGDIGKTYLGMRVAYDFTRGDTLLLTSLLSLCALVTGHNFPLWNLFRGGKGVTVTCTGIILITPTLGIPAVLIGFVIVLLTGWLPLGALVIPASYLLMCVFLLPEAVPFAIFLTAMMLLRHLPGLVSIFTGKCERVSPFDIFKKDKRMVDEPQPEELPEEAFAANADLPWQPAAGSVADEFIASMLS
ncbi:MAG: glycerol-3-phosphate acyltransferase [Lachnospiraceae bacterium]